MMRKSLAQRNKEKQAQAKEEKRLSGITGTKRFFSIECTDGKTRHINATFQEFADVVAEEVANGLFPEHAQELADQMLNDLIDGNEVAAFTIPAVKPDPDGDIIRARKAAEYWDEQRAIDARKNAPDYDTNESKRRGDELAGKMQGDKYEL